MKKFLALAITGFLVFASAGKGNAQNRNSSELPPGSFPTTMGGYTMTAKINGKIVKAHSIMPPDKTMQIVGFYNGDKYIGLPYSKKYFAVGKKN